MKRIADAAFKVRILGWLLRGAFMTWWNEVRHVDLDAVYCCSGHECGCEASTHREVWSWHRG